jgi:hypothetical protein
MEIVSDSAIDGSDLVARKIALRGDYRFIVLSYERY